MKKYFLSFILFFALPVLKINAQDSINPMNKQDKYLHAYLTFKDTFMIPCDCGDNIRRVAYKFELTKLFHGDYTNKYIIICVNSDTFISERQRWGGKQTTFWWTLMKTEKFYDGLPVYEHSGNF